MYKEPVMAQLRYYPGHLPEEKSWQCPLGLLVSRVLNSGPHKYKARVLPVQPKLSLIKEELPYCLCFHKSKRIQYYQGYFTWNNTHLSKLSVYTYLSWQDPLAHIWYLRMFIQYYYYYWTFLHKIHRTVLHDVF